MAKILDVQYGKPRVAYIKDVKANGVDGGSFTSGSYQVRTLNTLDDPTGIVTSLSTNIFTLPIGEYEVDITAPAYSVQAHKAKLVNVTASTDALLGTSMYMASATPIMNTSTIKGKLIVTSPTSYRVEHRCSATQVTGFGLATSFGDVETYTVVKITKVK